MGAAPLAFPSPAQNSIPPDEARSPAAVAAFGWYLRWYFWWNFHAVRVSLAGMPHLEPGRPVIVCANHPSWWDPALFMLLHTLLMRGRVGYGPMDARALEKYGLFRRMGVFGVEQDGARGAARFLEVSRRVMARPETVLWITAEGALTDARRRPVRLRPGIAHLARRVEGAVILPLALEFPFWTERRPEALARFGAPLQTGGARDVAAWTSLLEDRLTQAMDALAAESMARDPAAFRTLLRGSAGVGGVYDLWRRARALATRRRFDPSHGGEET